jgi:hypothetical protein
MSDKTEWQALNLCHTLELHHALSPQRLHGPDEKSRTSTEEVDLGCK